MTKFQGIKYPRMIDHHSFQNGTEIFKDLKQENKETQKEHRRRQRLDRGRGDNQN